MKKSKNEERPVEREAVRTTIVGGRPPGSGKGIGEIPRGIEVLVKKASVDIEFKKALLMTRSGAAKLIDLALEPAEAAILDVVPEAQLEAIIARTKVSPQSKAAFLGRAAVLMLAALGASVSVHAAGDGDLGKEGVRPDQPPVVEQSPVPDPPGVRPDQPPVVERPSVPDMSKGARPDMVSKGIRPDTIVKQTGAVVGLLSVTKNDEGAVTAARIVSQGGKAVYQVLLDDKGKELAALGNGAKVAISGAIRGTYETKDKVAMTVNITTFEKKTIPPDQNVQLTGKTTVTKNDKGVVTGLQLLALDEEIGGPLTYNVALDEKGKAFLEFVGKNADAEFKVAASVAEKDNVRTITVVGFALKPVAPTDLPDGGIRPNKPDVSRPSESPVSNGIRP